MRIDDDARHRTGVRERCSANGDVRNPFAVAIYADSSPPPVVAASSRHPSNHRRSHPYRRTRHHVHVRYPYVRCDGDPLREYLGMWRSSESIWYDLNGIVPTRVQIPNSSGRSSSNSDRNGHPGLHLRKLLTNSVQAPRGWRLCKAGGRRQHVSLAGVCCARRVQLGAGAVGFRDHPLNVESRW